MRLINADELIKDITTEFEICEDILELVDAQPTIEERKKGKWMIDNDLYRCSACNHLWSELWWAEIVPFEKMLKLMPYCPNCGADMRTNEGSNEIQNNSLPRLP